MVLMTGGALVVGLVIVVLAFTGIIGKSPVVDTNIVTPMVTTPTAVMDGHAIGQKTAPAQMTVWADFQCPVCGDFTRDVEPRLITDFVTTGKLQITYRNLIVIDSHVNGGHESRDAAAAAECAEQQNKFWQYHDWLFANQIGENAGSFTRDRLIAMAGKAGLDVNAFTACYDGGKTYATVDADSTEAHTLGFTSTPTIILNGKQVTDWTDYTALTAEIDAAASGSASPSASASPAASASASP